MILRCKRPDTGLVCDHPLPCPQHTFIADLQDESITIPPRAMLDSLAGLKRLEEIMEILEEQRHEPE